MTTPDPLAMPPHQLAAMCLTCVAMGGLMATLVMQTAHRRSTWLQAALLVVLFSAILPASVVGFLVLFGQDAPLR